MSPYENYQVRSTKDVCARLLARGDYPTPTLVNKELGLRGGNKLSGERARARREFLLANGYVKDERTGRFKLGADPDAIDRGPAVKPAAGVAASTVLGFANDRQRELARIIGESFTNYKVRGQYYYELEGMSTSHIVVKAIADMKSIRIFWPKDLVRTSGWGGENVQYILTDDALERMQNAVRDTLKQLYDRGYVEQLGNEHERRWRPTKSAGLTA